MRGLDGGVYLPVRPGVPARLERWKDAGCLSRGTAPLTGARPVGGRRSGAAGPINTHRDRAERAAEGERTAGERVPEGERTAGERAEMRVARESEAR